MSKKFNRTLFIKDSKTNQVEVMIIGENEADEGDGSYKTMF